MRQFADRYSDAIEFQISTLRNSMLENLEDYQKMCHKMDQSKLLFVR